jgi:hypothetical protein
VPAQVVSVTRLSGLERGAGRQLVLDREGQDVLIKIDVNGEDESVTRYGFYLRSGDRETFLTSSVAGTEYTLRLSRTLFEVERDYELVVRVQPGHDNLAPIETFKFHTVFAGQ